jgi:dTDP-4-dehydrorhamnose 3,5-epimerase
MNIMQVIALKIPEVKLIIPKKFGDNRGFFSETYKQADLQAAGIEETFIQDNHSLSESVGTLRGLHYQKPPYAQAKIIRVLRGRILDVVVDIRKNSPTFGEHVSVELSAENWSQIYVPIGFAHGFITLEPDCELAYKMSNYYAPDHEEGIRWNDPTLAIDWQIPAEQVQLSAKDTALPFFNDVRDGVPF